MLSNGAKPAPGSATDEARDGLPTAHAMRAFTPLSRLTHAAMHDLRPHMLIYDVEPGTIIFSTGDNDDWAFFLVEGAVTLSNAEHVCVVKAGDAVALEALSSHVPRRETATVNEKSKLLRVPLSLLDMLSAPGEAGGYAVEEIDAEDTLLDNALMFQILSDYQSNKISIPSLPEVVLRIRQAVADPDVDIAVVERLVAADPGVAARLVQVANSARYQSGNSVNSVREAVSRVGLKATRDIVTALAMKHLFKTDNPALKARMKRLWEHSTWVAAISYHLAELTKSVDPDLAMLGGLVHDLGAVAIVAHAPRYEALRDLSALGLTIAELRGPVGALILRRWNFTDELVTVALEAEDWQRDRSGPPDCCDVVVLAQLLSYSGRAEGARLPQASSVPAFGRLCLGEQKASATLELLKSAKRSIKSMQRALLALTRK